MAIETSDMIVDPDKVADSWPDLALSLSYWHDRLRDGNIPARDDIDLLDLSEVLPQVNLIDVHHQPDGPLRYRHRMEGSLLVERFKRDSTGKWFDENYDASHLARQLGAYDDAVRSKRPNLARIRIVTGDVVEIDYTRLIMPLAPPGEAVNMLFVVFSFNKFSDAAPGVLPIHRGQG